MKKITLMAFAFLCSLTMWAQSNEMVEMYVAPGKLWSNWSEDYTLVVSVKRWNGLDTDADNWASFEFSPIGTTFDGAGVYKGKIEILFGGFAEMKFEAKDHEADFNYLFWPPETSDGHWIVKADWESKIFISWNKDNGIREFLHYSDTRYHLYVKNENRWSNSLYLRWGNDANSYVVPFNRINGTDWWMCYAPDACQMTMFTITDNGNNAGAGIAVNAYADGTNRLYENQYSISTDHWYVIGEDYMQEGNYYSWGMEDYYDAYPYPASLITSEAGHRVYFDNSASQWNDVCLRIGRTEVAGMSSYASTWHMTKMENSDIWYVDTEDWDNAEAWTITDTDANNGDGYSAYDLPAGANRLYFYNYSIDTDILYSATGNAPQGVENGAYWGNFRSELYTRSVTAGNYGTICLPKAATLFAGAEMYRIINKAGVTGIEIEQVTAMEAGVPYIFLATDAKLLVTLTGDAQPAQAVNGLVGHISDEALTVHPDGDNRFILQNNKLWMADIDVIIPSNRAYIDMSAIVPQVQAPSMKRYIIGANNVATGVEQISEEPNANSQKLLKGGQLIIIRNGVEYNANGQMTK